MGGFFPHLGNIPTQGYTTLPCTTFNAALDDIVNDLGVGVNGWTLYDDQRGIQGLMTWPWNGGWNSSYYSNQQKDWWYFISGSPNVGWGYTYNGSGQSQYSDAGRANWDFGINSITQLSWDNGANWYGVLSVQSYQDFKLDRNYTGSTYSGGATCYMMVEGYIVLKCTSSQKNFYLKISRPKSFGSRFLVFQVFETWNASTHTGTGGGPRESVRAYSNATIRTGTSTVMMILFFLPDAFAMWSCGDLAAVSGGQTSDLYYCGNLTPLRSNDNTCVIQVCTNQDFSGIGVNCISPLFNNNTAGRGSPGNYPIVGAAMLMRNLQGTLWWDNTSKNAAPFTNMYSIVPRGMDYIYDVSRTNFDESAKMQFTEYDAYHSGTYNNGNVENEGKRGELKYIKSPIMNPSGLHLASLGPSDDGNTYMCIHNSNPWADTQYNGNYPYEGGYATPQATSLTGWAYTQRVGSIGNLGTGPAAVSPVFFRTKFLLPINL